MKKFFKSLFGNIIDMIMDNILESIFWGVTAIVTIGTAVTAKIKSIPWGDFIEPILGIKLSLWIVILFLLSIYFIRKIVFYLKKHN